MDCEQLPLAGNLEQNFTLPKIVVFCRKSRSFFGASAAFVSVHAHQTLTGRLLIPAAGRSLPEVHLTGRVARWRSLSCGGDYSMRTLRPGPAWPGLFIWRAGARFVLASVAGAAERRPSAIN
jgi:hypothetical protein